MLRRIVLIITENYKKNVQDLGELAHFIKEMEKHGAEVDVFDESNAAIEAQVHGKNEAESAAELGWRELFREMETLFFSDDAAILSQLQEKGSYTVAVYHEGVSGLLSGTQFAVEGMKDMDWEYLNKVYQRFTGEPWSISETARCTLREMVPADVDALYELYSSSKVTRYMEPLYPKKEQEEQYIKDYIENVYKYYGFGTWLIHRKEDGKLIGRAGFNYRAGFEEAELGFMIGEPFWGQGYAYEVCSHLMELAERVYELGRIQALVKKENTASLGLLQKLGFSYAEDVTLDGEEYQRYVSELALLKDPTYNSCQ